MTDSPPAEKAAASGSAIAFPPSPPDRRGCPGNCQPHNCPNMACVSEGWDGERYRCDVCGEGFFLDYDEMK